MERILLVEPNYKNKYPPIGLMKISTYFKNKGDFVEFHKGLLPKVEAETFDKVFITTLFTFDFEMCVQTINYYVDIVGINKVFVGGIAATIMPDRFLERISNLRILPGQLISSNVLGYNDDVNVDIVELDYDILWDVSYEYPAADSYFIYTTRGCPRKCSFCAVKTLEPQFYDCDNLIQQLTRVDEHFGTKKNLLIMDNNILYSKRFDQTIDELKQLGFSKGNNKIKKNNNMKYYISSLERRLEQQRKTKYLLERIRKELSSIKYSRISLVDQKRLKDICSDVKKLTDESLIAVVLDEKEYLVDFFERYNYHTITRYVDFNQGLDARLFDIEKAKKMAEIAVKPCRIAFDNLSTKDEYVSAMKAAMKAGIKHFSNYLLYNYDEKPESLWTRIHINVELSKENKDKVATLFSFPMRYASIEHTNRDYVGELWHKKYLRAMNVILNVTAGVVAKEEDFFLRAYGKSEEEFKEILMMPDDYIRFRSFFEEKGLAQTWKLLYSCLSEEQSDLLVNILDNMVDDPDVLNRNYDFDIDNILFFYKIKKKNVEENELYYKNKILELKNLYSDKN